MIRYFSFKNFKSYRSETIFDFKAAAIPEFKESLLSSIESEKDGDILPVSVLYGPNGGGKTNLLQALACLISIVVRPVAELEKNRESLVLQHYVSCQPYLLDDESQNEPTEFQIYFRIKTNEYRYYIAVKNGTVVSESLYWRAIGGHKTGTVFEREKSEITLGSTINKVSVNRLVNPKMPYLSFLAINYNIPVISEVVTWFESCIIQSYAVPEVDRQIMMADNVELKKKIIRALNDLDIDIMDYRYDTAEKELYTRRILEGKEYELPFSSESDGTKKLLAALPILLIALQDGRLVIIDELDAKLHPKLLRYIIRLFKNPEVNRRGAQLMFSSHDLTTMKNSVFRRDEIWFSALDRNHESKIYSLYDIRDENDRHVNSSAAFDKQYMEGRYGADPYLENLLGEEWL